MLEDVARVDACTDVRVDWQSFEDVAVLDIARKPLAVPHVESSQNRNALEAQRRRCIENRDGHFFMRIRHHHQHDLWGMERACDTYRDGSYVSSV